MSRRSVRDVAFDVLREYELTTIFANPGSTEVALLAGLPEDLRFVLALHEGSVVGIATGWAIAHVRPALVVLHTAAGLGNAVGALATARANRAPLVVLVGQQDRRHLPLEPFLAGKLGGLAGDYPVWAVQPALAADVPGAIARAAHEATTGRGPALVIVPMDDWAAVVDDTDELRAAPALLRSAGNPDQATIAELAEAVNAARHPALVVGAGADGERSWAALVSLAGRLDCPVWQEAFGARAGFPQDDPLFAGHLPAGRAELRATLSGYDLVLAVGAPVFRQFSYEPGPLLPHGIRTALVTDNPSEAHHSPADLAVLGAPGAVCEALAEAVRVRPRRPVTATATLKAQVSRPVDQASGPLRAADVFRALAPRLPADAVVVEETPSSRAELEALLPARAPLGFLSAAMGGLGFAVPAATGVRMARPDRPVVAVVGDGSALYGIHALWTAAHYSVGVLFVVLANGRYAIMDDLADRSGGKPPWPGFGEVRVSEVAQGLGCPARRLETTEDLMDQLDQVVPTLRERSAPLLLDIAVTFPTSPGRPTPS
ncbi:MAG: thiamine pyrophosphate-dependent enzyme [Streptosporangiaceae bacterium]